MSQLDELLRIKYESADTDEELCLAVDARAELATLRAALAAAMAREAELREAMIRFYNDEHVGYERRLLAANALGHQPYCAELHDCGPCDCGGVDNAPSA